MLSPERSGPGARRRRTLKSLIGALCIAAACLAIAASGVPRDATAKGGNGLPDDVETMKEAFEAYIQSIETMTGLFVAADAFTLDPAHSVGAYDLITAFIHSANRSHNSSSGTGRRGYPRFAGFDDPDTRIGVDNPDTQYMGTIVNNASGNEIFRVFGNRSNSVDFILTLFDTSTGTGGLGVLEDEDMVIAPDGSYEVFFSSAALRDLSWDNWVELPALDGIQIARRHSHCDWPVERPGEVHIERLGTAGVPSLPLSPAIMTQQINDAILLNEIQGPFWPAFIDSIQNNIPVNTATPWLPTGGLGITTQLSMLMWFDLEDDEAMIIRLTDEDPRLADKAAKYYGLQLANFWGSSADWANRQVSANWGLDGACQSEQAVGPAPHPAQQLITSQGGPNCGFQKPYYVVVSKQDPGVQNWVDTAELSQGILAGRLQSVDSSEFPFAVGLGSCLLPVAFPPMPVNQVAPFLQSIGGASPGFTPADRAAQLEVRQKFVRDKYIFW